MDTDQLIRTLAADNAHRARPVGFVLMLALLAAAPVSLAMFFAELGVRPDVMTAMRNPFFDLKFAVTLALAISAIAVSLHLSRPEASLRGWAWLLLIPVGLLVAGIGGEMMMPQRLPMMTRMVGNNSLYLPDRHSADVAAAAGGGADRLAPRRADAARGRRRHRRTAVGGPGGDAVRLALHRRFTAVRGDLVHASPPRWSPPSARWRDRGCCGFSFRPRTSDDVVIAAHAAGAAVCCMRWKRSTCCAVEGRSRS